MKIILLACLIVLMSGIQLAASNWPMFLNDTSHSGFVGETIESNLYMKWTQSIGSRVFGSPVIAENRVYAGTDKGELYCFDLFSGTLVWKYYITQGESGNTDPNKKVPTSIMCTPAYDDGAVYFTSYNGYLYCVNAMTGSRIWSKSIGGNVIASPIVSNGLVFCGSTSNKGILAFNAKTGSLASRFPSYEIVQSVPAVYGNRLYFGDNQGTVYCYDLNTSAKVWEYALPTGFIYVSGPSADESGIFLFPAYGSRLDVSGNNLFQFAADTGNVLWSADPFGLGSQKASQRKTIESLVDGMRFRFNPDPQNPTLLHGLNIDVDAARKNPSALKAKLKSALKENLTQRYKARRMKASSYKAMMSKAEDPQVYPKQYASSIVVRDQVAYMIVLKPVYTSMIWQGTLYYNHSHFEHTLLAVDLELKKVKFSKVLGTSKEMHSDIAPSLPATDVVDFNRYSTAPVISGDKIIALTPGGKVRMFDRSNGNLLFEEGGYSLFYGSPAYSSGRLVVVDKFGKIGCYGIDQNEAAKIEIIEPAEQKVIENELMVKWSIFNPNPAKIYFIHFYYDEDATGYNGKSCAGLSYKKSTGVPIGSWSANNVTRERFYYLYAVMTDAPFGSNDPIAEAKEVYYSAYTRYPVLVTNDEKAPSISILNPVGEVYLDPDKQSSYIINWIDYDKDSNAEVSLYYSPTGSMINAQLIKSGISEDDSNDFFVFDVRRVLNDENVKAAGGVAYIIGKIWDGEGSAKFATSPGWLKVKMDVSEALDSLSLSHTPIYGPQEIGAYLIRAYVKGPKSIQEEGYVKLFYKTSPGAQYTEVVLTSSDFFQYTGQIPQIAGGSTVYYYIEAYDGSDLVTSPATDPAASPHTFMVKSAELTGWSGKLNISVSEGADPDYFVWGMDKSASDYKDASGDIDEPELTDTGLSIFSTVTSDNGQESCNLGTDIRQERDLGAQVMKNILTIKARNLQGKEITMSWDILGVPGDYGVQLIDDTTGEYINLKESSGFAIPVTSADFSVRMVLTTGLSYFEKAYRKGWNLVSFPVKAVDENLVPEKIGKIFNQFMPGKKYSVYHYHDGEFQGFDPKFGGKLSYFNIGKGYWINLPEEAKISLKGLDVRYEESARQGIFTYHLKGGDWNLIGCPKFKSVPFSDLAVKYQGETLNISDAIEKGLIKPYYFWYELFGFNLGFMQDEGVEMYPGYGYFIKSEVDCSILVSVDSASSFSPPPKKGEKAVVKRQKKTIFADVKKWKVKVSVACAEYKDRDNYFGIDENSLDGPDFLDVLEPMSITPGISLYFPHPEFRSSDKGNYTMDTREPVASEGSIVWDMELVKYDIATENSTISWELSDFPPDYKLVLKNLNTGKEYNMLSVKQASVSLKNNEAVKFRITYYKNVKP